MLQQRHPLWRQFERDYIRNEPKGWHANIGDFEMLLEHAEYMGALPLSDPLEGIEDDIRLAKALSVKLPASKADGQNRCGDE